MRRRTLRVLRTIAGAVSVPALLLWCVYGVAEVYLHEPKR